MLGLPWVIQGEGRKPKKWSAIILVPMKEKYEKDWRIMAVIGCVRTGGFDKPTHVATSGDLIEFEEGVAPLFDMHCENDCVAITIPGHSIQVSGGGGTVFIKAVKEGGAS